MESVSDLVGGHEKEASAGPQVTHRVVRNGDIDIAVYEQGNRAGETLLLLHGWPDSHDMWNSVTPHLIDRFRVVTVDNRGHGQSSNPKSYREFKLAALASDYLAVIDAVGDGKPVHVLAHDWGSVAMWEAVCDPTAQHKIASFTSVAGPNAAHLTMWARHRLSRPTPKNVAHVLAQVASLLYMAYFALPLVPKAFFRMTMTAERWRTGLSRVEGADANQIWLGPTFDRDIGNGLRIYRANILSALKPRDQFTQVPVQVIVGTNDPAVRAASYSDELKWAPAVWQRVVRGGHWLPFSHPELLATATTELIDAVSGLPPTRGLRRAEMGRKRRPFDDQLVVITGAGSGIGRETAIAFARDGAEVVVSDVNLASAKETAALIGELGADAHAYQLDVSDEAAVVAHAEQVVAAHGVPDVLVNNAGVGQAGRFLATTSDEFKRVLDVNLYGVVNGCRAFGPKMVSRGLGGHIVNLSSMAAYTPQQGFTAYSTSKSAVFMFSDCLRAELASAGIGVSTICPGIVHTNIVRSSVVSGLSEQEAEKKLATVDRAYRLRRYGPDKVAKQIVAAVRKNKSVVPVTPEARLQYLAHRLAPGIGRIAARKVALG
ncbi:MULTISPECIES: SDR family oxidoreductase [unclassified Mycobacterium]|uniref:SDR family oxidoreductase n=1 Tax=unclassified Mycobacterium TaxID=2642494 RepID=UPI00073FF692|nr:MULTISPECIES: SDR family oxidoreductase [unclassified Mycobacterium]KUH81997.1 short-chain dehydrogenase [Mycobacterium sp. IS-1556]KUH82366.1 short-chain dehydrogenase [Mycobacterium sp. GA-0227b]KUH88959.1 short-chain dehydrogenase [Mycobacterium sp. GA-1999]